MLTAVQIFQICCQFKGMCPPQKDVESIELEASMRDFSALNPLAQEFVPGANKKTPAPANKPQALVTKCFKKNIRGLTLLL